MVVAVFDIGGSHLSYGAIDIKTQRLAGKTESLLHSDRSDSANALEVLVKLVTGAKVKYGNSLCGLSLAVPNPFDHLTGVSQMRHKLVSLYGINLRRRLSEVASVPEKQIVFLNDADAFLLGALRTKGVATGRFIGITLGTGIGSAFAIDQEIVFEGEGVSYNGEIWDLPYGSSTVEDAISTRTLERDYGQRTGVQRTVKSMAHTARRGDLEALKVFDDFGICLGKVLQFVGATFQPDRIILGGGITAAADLFMPKLLANTWCAHRVEVLLKSETAPLLGAAAAWQRSVTVSTMT